jgi:hypothetical protein
LSAALILDEICGAPLLSALNAQNILRLYLVEPFAEPVYRNDQQCAPGLVHVEMFTDVRAAISREKQIKGWRREKKIALIETDNPSWGDLAENWFPKLIAHADPSPRLNDNRSSG